MYAFVRLPNRGSFGSTVQLHTPLGIIELNGRVMSFDSHHAASQAFEAAGLVTAAEASGRRRRLISLRTLIGLYSRLTEVEEWDGLLDGEDPPVIQGKGLGFRV